MFGRCKNLKEIPLISTSNLQNMDYMFKDCENLIKISSFNTSTVLSMNETFKRCKNLTTIPFFDVSNVKYFKETFEGCESLKEINMKGMITSFDISSSTKFTRDALIEILNNLSWVSNQQVLTIGQENLSKLSDEDIKIAVNKGWLLK